MLGLHFVVSEWVPGVQAVAPGPVLVGVGLAQRHLRLQRPDSVLVLHDHRLQLPDLVGELLQRLVLKRQTKQKIKKSKAATTL